MPTLPSGFSPFDGGALVAMLQAFYPTVSGAAFALARRERPEYFGGGVIFGSKGDKLRLPDGREYDCIFAAGGPPSARRWTCSLIDPTAGGDEDPFALEDGPLEAVDEEIVIFPGGDPSFESLVTGPLGTLNGAEERLDGSAEAIVAWDGADRVDGSFRALVEPATDAHKRMRAVLDNDNPADVIAATNAHDPEIDGARGDYVEPAPPDTPERDPGDRPRDDDDDKGPPKKGDGS